jgi:hypothetical protein
VPLIPRWIDDHPKFVAPVKGFTSHEMFDLLFGPLLVASFYMPIL